MNDAHYYSKWLKECERKLKRSESDAFELKQALRRATLFTMKDAPLMKDLKKTMTNRLFDEVFAEQASNAKEKN